MPSDQGLFRVDPGSRPLEGVPPPGPALVEMARADRYLALAHAMAFQMGTARSRGGQPPDAWQLVAAALHEAQALLHEAGSRPCPAGDPGRLPGHLLTPSGRSCAHLVRLALTQLRWIPTGAHSPCCADAATVAQVALTLIGQEQEHDTPSAAGDDPELRHYLAPDCFPADREELLDHAARRHAPPPVLHLLMRLPRHRNWPGLPAVLGELGVLSPRQDGRR